MQCPKCGENNSTVKDSRPIEELVLAAPSEKCPTPVVPLQTIRRRRDCEECGHRWRTIEIEEVFATEALRALLLED